MSRQLELPLGSRDEVPRAERSAEEQKATHEDERSGASGLMELVCERQNLFAALKRVRKTKGSAGIDGMTVDELPTYLKTNWPALREQLLAGTYQPSAVKRQEIPKRGGGVRDLGIRTVVDRFIQQAILQVREPRFDPTFSEHAFGFRRGRRAHDAIVQAQRYVSEGRTVVVDVDLEKFFDRVNHDVLMERVARRIEDKRLLRLIRAYLEAGVMANGVVLERYEGTPQGGPLSPLLANVLLDEVDKELERRGHAFVRYADDCNVYVRSKRAGRRAMALLRELFTKLRLRINESKSAVGSVLRRKLLGFSFWRTISGPSKGRIALRVAPTSLDAMKDRVRELTRRNCGRSMAQVVEGLRSFLLGWRNYFRLASTPHAFSRLDTWVRHRLRALQLKHWKNGYTIYRELRARGLPHVSAAKVAVNVRSWWRNSTMAINIAFPTHYFDKLGVPRLAA